MLLFEYVKLDHSFYYQVLIEVWKLLIILIFIILSMFVCIICFCHIYGKKISFCANLKAFLFQTNKQSLFEYLYQRRFLIKSSHFSFFSSIQGSSCPLCDEIPNVVLKKSMVSAYYLNFSTMSSESNWHPTNNITFFNKTIYQPFATAWNVMFRNSIEISVFNLITFCIIKIYKMSLDNIFKIPFTHLNSSVQNEIYSNATDTSVLF